jgi:hypothetical protein
MPGGARSGIVRAVQSRDPRSNRRHAAAGFAAAALAALVVYALAAPERPAAPRGGEYAASARQPVSAPGAAGGRGGPNATVALRFRVAEPGGAHVTALRVHSRLPCPDGRAVDDDVALTLPRGGAIPRRGPFTVRAHGVRVQGFFVSPDRVTGTLTRTHGRCAVAAVPWTARRTV